MFMNKIELLLFLFKKKKNRIIRRRLNTRLYAMKNAIAKIEHPCSEITRPQRIQPPSL